MTTLIKATQLTPKRPSGRFAPLSLFRHVATTYRQRRSLKRLDHWALNDIGLSRRDAQQEAKRPIWDVLDTWRT